MSANLRAFLALLRWCEGTAGPEGYRTIVGGSLMDTYDDHPRIVKSGTFSDGVPWKSSAAGAYQFLSTTWDECKAALSLPDFSPASQDAAAVFLIKRRGALDDVEAGRIAEAIAKCNREWASLPGSPYGQPVKTLDACLRVYQAAGGSLSTQPAGTDSSAQPTGSRTETLPAPAAPSSKETTMPAPLAPVILAAGQALLPLVIDFFRGRGSKTSDRNADILEQTKEALPVLVEIAKTVAPDAPNEQAVAEAILASKELQAQFKAAVAVRWQDIEPFMRFEEESRAAARHFVGGLMTEGPTWQQIGSGVLIGLLSLTIIFGGGAMFWSMMNSPQLDPGQKGLILGALLSVFSSTAAFWFGSSASSRVKDQTISEQARK